MAVAFDNKGNTTSNGTSVSSLTSPNFLMAANAVAILIIVWRQATIPTGTIVNWNTSEALTAIVGASQANATQSETITAYGIGSPSSGTHTFSASWTGGAIPASMGYISFTGANRTGGTTTFPHGANNFNNSAGTTASVTVTTVVGDMTVAGFQSPGNITSTNTGTNAWIDNTGEGMAGSYQVGSAGSNAMTATITTSDTFISCGFDIVAGVSDVLQSQGLM